MDGVRFHMVGNFAAIGALVSGDELEATGAAGSVVEHKADEGFAVVDLVCGDEGKSFRQGQAEMQIFRRGHRIERSNVDIFNVEGSHGGLIAGKVALLVSCW